MPKSVNKVILVGHLGKDPEIKYTPQGGRVTVRCQREDSVVCIEVIDTGIGIPQDEQQRIFERFYRAEVSRSKDYGGSGLGLAIVKWIAEAHGGSVSVQSTFGEDTTFTVTFPLRLRHHKQPPRRDRRVQRAPAARPRARRQAPRRHQRSLKGAIRMRV